MNGYLLFCLINIVILIIDGFVHYHKHGELETTSQDLVICGVTTLLSVVGTAFIIFVFILKFYASNKTLIKFEKKGKVK